MIAATLVEFSSRLVQAWARMLLAGQARTRARRASTTLASAWRMKSAVTTKNQAISSIIAWQVRVYCALASVWVVCVRERGTEGERMNPNILGQFLAKCGAQTPCVASIPEVVRESPPRAEEHSARCQRRRISAAM